MNPHLASIPGVTEDRRAMIQAELKAFQAEVDPLRDRLMAGRLEPRDLLHQANPDQVKAPPGRHPLKISRPVRTPRLGGVTA